MCASAARCGIFKMFAPAWVKDAIFYQIFPDRFCRSGRYHAVGKFVEWGSKPTRENMFGGNLAGIEDKLEYIAGLGVNAIYLCPIFKSNSNHRYHTVDYFEIDPVLGTLEDFDRLIKKAHKLKLRVILDGVFNHCSRGFFQFNSLMELGEHSPYVDWFHVKGWPLNAYTDKPNYECWWNFPALPKFNTDCPDVREYLFSVGEYWMKRGIDGWRLDVPNEIDDDSFWQEFRRRVKAVNPDAYIVGEIWDEPSRLMNYMFRKAAMQFLFDEKPISIKEFGERMSRAFPEGRGDIPMNLLGSHDTTRLMSQPCASLERIELAYAILFFLPGAPCIYYGEELSMKGGKDPDNRRSVPWSKLAEMQAKPLYEFIKQMIALRKKNAVLRNGSLEIRAADNGFAIERSLGKKKMTIVVLQDGTEFKFNIV